MAFPQILQLYSFREKEAEVEAAEVGTTEVAATEVGATETTTVVALLVEAAEAEVDAIAAFFRCLHNVVRDNDATLTAGALYLT